MRENHDRQMIAKGYKAWETLAVSSWAGFIDRLWQEYLLAPKPKNEALSLLTQWQERFLWMQILSSKDSRSQLLNLPAAAQLVAQANSISLSFGLQEGLDRQWEAWDSETKTFLEWQKLFRKRLEQENWIERARLEEALGQALAGGIISSKVLPAKLELRGFTQLTPAQKKLLDRYQSLGFEVAFAKEAESITSNWRFIQALEGESELSIAARWIRAILERTAVDDSLPKIGLVVSDLAAQREQVIGYLNEALAPEESLQLSGPKECLYNLSLGKSLAAWPLVQDALSLISIDGSWQPLTDFGVLFHSPFIAKAESERQARALLEARLLEDGIFKVDPKTIIGRATQSATERQPEVKPWSCPKLAEILETVLEDIRTCSRRLSPSQWVSQFKQTLDSFGWPGERVLDSAEYQTLAAWNELLFSLGSLDRVTPLISRREAVATIRRMAEETIYQPRFAHGPIEVLGYLEAAGMSFDYLWVSGLHDGAWPQPAHPNPYLPTSLQKFHKVPHSSAERELEYAHLLTEQLLAGAPVGVMSCEARDKDQSLRPSMLVKSLPLVEVASLKLAASEAAVQTIYLSSRTELVVDVGPQAILKTASLKGGSSILKHQSACPFKAFAVVRLGAKELAEVEIGLNAGERGELLHAVLERFWSRAKSQTVLLTGGQDRSEQLIAQAVEESILRAKKKRPDVFSPAFIEIERERLALLCRQWLALEKERLAFEVLSTEQMVEVELEGLTLRLRIDRIDRLEDGSLMVIDYKTGMASVKDWFGERPAEPQLPLYAVANPGLDSIKALAYAHLRRGEMKFSGIGESSSLPAGLDLSNTAGELGMPWEERLQEWARVVHKLALDFRQGKAEIDPVEKKKTCDSCHLKALCRIEELKARRSGG